MRRKKKALVLGVTGMVGYPLAEALLDDGWEVYGAARFHGDLPPECLIPKGCQPIRFDVTRDLVHELPDVDVLFLEIWDPSRPEQIWEINYYGVGRVVERYSGIADIVHGSTINVYGDQSGAPDEDTLCRPTTSYGVSRLALEHLIAYFSFQGGKKENQVRYAHANTAEKGVIRRIAEMILAGKSLGKRPDAFIQVIGLEDFVRVTYASLARMEQPPNAVNCCHPQLWTYRTLAEAIHNRLGSGRVIFDREMGGQRIPRSLRIQPVWWPGLVNLKSPRKS